MILLPNDWPDWNESQRRAVLAHELAHICRNDVAAWTCAQIGLALHFYHPLVHWLAHRLRLEQELAADATAATLVGGQRNYLTTLAQLALEQAERPVPWPARTFLPTRRTFLRRIEVLRDSKHLTTTISIGTRAATVCVILLAGFTAAGLRGPSVGNKDAKAAETAAAEPKLPQGSGLFYRLPKDGTWARYDVKTTYPESVKLPIRQLSLTMSSVGQLTVDGEKCRWIELKMARLGHENQPLVPPLKVLIPEKSLRKGESPIGRVLQGWWKLPRTNDIWPIRKRNPPFAKMPLRALLPGPLEKIEQLDPREIVIKKQKLLCPGLTGQTQFKQRPNDIKLTYEIRLHEKAPFGVVSCRVDVEERRGGELKQSGSLVFTLADFGTDATSEIAAPKVGKLDDREQSRHNLRRLALAMWDYHVAHKHFPPAVVMGKDGKGKTPHSWRVALLPFLEAADLYEQYKFDEPWDSPDNKKVLEKMPGVFRAPRDKPGSTNSGYFVITGPETAFPGKETVRVRDILDGTSNTLLAVETKRNIPWTKPEDIPYDPKKPLPKLGGFEKGGFYAALCDGTIRFISETLDEKIRRAIITKAAGSGR